MAENRTAEFLAIAGALPSGPSKPAPAPSSSYAELRDFHQTAAGISRDIASTSALLQELTQLVRHKSMFEDDSAKVNQLVVRIKSSIENLNSRLDQAGTSIAAQKRRLGQNSQAGQEAANLVDGLKTEFAQAASGFKKVLQQRTDNLKETDEFQRQVYGGDKDDAIPIISTLAPPPVYSSAPPSLGFDSAPSQFPTLDLTSGMMAAGEPTGPTLPRPHGITTVGGGSDGMRNRRQSSELPTYSGSYSTYERAHSTPLTPWDIQRMEEESGAAQMMQLIPDQDYLRDRADAMSQVESHIVELGTVFNKLAVMVSEHREMVQRVEDNVEDASANINLSLNVLTDTLTNLRSNRQLALRVFSILVAFIIFFIVFFA